MKTIVIIAVVAVLMAGAAFIVVTMFLKPAVGPATSPTETESHQDDKEHANGAGGEGATGEVYLVDNLLINPTGTSGTRYLSTSLGLEVKSKEIVPQLQARDLQVRDLLISILSARTVEQLTDPAQRETMRGEILKRLNELMAGGQIAAVYFVDYVMQ